VIFGGAAMYSSFLPVQIGICGKRFIMIILETIRMYENYVKEYTSRD